MSENKHTPEPWVAIPGGRHDPEVIITTQHRIDMSLGEICGMDVEFTGKHGEEQKANACRIVACVNACAGISTENLEDNLPIKELARRYNETLKQRDELLAALENIVEMNPALPMGMMEAAESAIASVKGPWCCEKGQSQGKQVCDECAEINDGYQSCLCVSETSIPAIVFYPAGSLGEPVEDPIVPCDDASTGHIMARIINANPAEI